MAQQTAYTLYFELATGMTFGSPWFVNRQPAWVSKAVAWPASGSL